MLESGGHEVAHPFALEDTPPLNGVVVVFALQRDGIGGGFEVLYVPLREVLRPVGLPCRRGEVDPLHKCIFEVFHLRHEMGYDALPCAEVVAEDEPSSVLVKSLHQVACNLLTAFVQPPWVAILLSCDLLRRPQWQGQCGGCTF